MWYWNQNKLSGPLIDCFSDYWQWSFIGPLRCFSLLDLLLNSSSDAVTVQIQQNNDFADGISFVDLNKRKGKSIYISGPSKILSKNMYWLKWCCRRKNSKENSISKSTENEVFSTLKEKIRKLKELYFWSQWALGVNSIRDLATGCLSSLLNIMQTKFSSRVPGVSLLAPRLMVCNRCEAVFFIPPLITRSLLRRPVCECDMTYFYR